MTGTREIADASPADVFAYSEAFVLMEQYVTILWSTFKTIGSTLAGKWFCCRLVFYGKEMFSLLGLK